MVSLEESRSASGDGCPFESIFEKDLLVAAFVSFVVVSRVGEFGAGTTADGAILKVIDGRVLVEKLQTFQRRVDSWYIKQRTNQVTVSAGDECAFRSKYEKLRTWVTQTLYLRVEGPDVRYHTEGETRENLCCSNGH